MNSPTTPPILPAGPEPNWEWYRSFLAVLDAGSLSAAARVLGLTQPTLGRHVDQLEQALALKLFTRSFDGFAPTEAALELRPGLPAARPPPVAGRHADDLAAPAQQQRAAGKAGKDLDAQLFRLRAQPSADLAERRDDVAAIGHQRRQQDLRERNGAPLAEKHQAVRADRGERRNPRPAAPIGQ